MRNANAVRAKLAASGIDEADVAAAVARARRLPGRAPAGAFGSYQLLIEVAHRVRCTVGRLGTFDFPAGMYVYTGSARTGLEARIARHLRAAKTLRWHVDYLLAAPGVRVTRVVRSRREECALNGAVRGSVPVPRFGASDCRAGCGAHLKLLGALRPAR
jgi:Uri superfamily endonuclease